MSSTTKRWMQEELTQLVSQRRQMKAATQTAQTPAQRRRRTQRLRALDEEILGRSEALAALERHARDEVVVRRDEAEPAGHRPVPRRPTAAHRAARRRPTAAFRTLATQRAPKIGDTLSLMATPRTEPTRAVARVAGGAFALGFFLTAVTMWSTGLGQPQVGPVRAQQQAVDETPKPAPVRNDRRRQYEDRVFAATAPAKRR